MKKTIDRIALLVCMILFGVCAMLTPVLLKGSAQTCNVLVFCGAALAFALVYLGIGKASAFNESRRQMNWPAVSDGGAFSVCFIFFAAVGIWNLLAFYPGTGMYDTLAILTRKLSQMANQHPWFYCLIIRAVVRVVFCLGGDYETTLVVCSLLQIAVTAAVYSGCLVWMKQKDVHPVVWIASVLFLGLYPIFGLYMVTLFKDIPYSLLLMAWVPALYEYWESGGACLRSKKYWCGCVLLLVFSLLRNNGVYVSAFILMAMLVVNVRQWKKIGVLLMVLVLVVAGSKAFEKHYKITHLFKETVGIPLQQIAAVVVNDGQISEEQLEFIDAVIPVEFIREKYDPYTADRLKWGGAPLDNDFLNSHKGEFLKTWLELFLDNKAIYLKAYLQNTYGFWSLDDSDRNVKYTTLYADGWEEWFQENDVGVKNVFPEAFQARIDEMAQKWIRPLGAGTFFWIFVLLMLVLMKRSGWKILVLAAPAVGCWGTLMISTPVAYQWRYLLCVPITLPLIFGLLFARRKGVPES